ncbi:hypothetical protein QOZ80_2BG0184040 [Eleusine coracana subsp. coracana]|nr:hypothetical protein QOZ80_2BG0184040 [Eleusine coracana subsp. coracana]
MDAGLRRIHEAVCDVRKRNYSREGVGSIRSAVMSYIHGYYKDALDRVPPSLIPLIKKAGFCFGFLDPVSNIIANTVSFGRLMAEQGRHEKKRKRSRAGTSNNEKMNITGDIEARSLEGLVVFLTSYFRYLPDEEALRYLRMSKADLLVAVHLIEEDRDSSDAFNIDLETTKISTTCAALCLMRPIDTMDLSE